MGHLSDSGGACFSRSVKFYFLNPGDLTTSSLVGEWISESVLHLGKDFSKVCYLESFK